MKCDRQGKAKFTVTLVYITQELNMCHIAVPCSNCVRRHRVEFCVAAATTNTGESRLVLCTPE
jgi:hypothetical protein